MSPHHNKPGESSSSSSGKGDEHPEQPKTTLTHRPHSGHHHSSGAEGSTTQEKKDKIVALRKAIDQDFEGVLKRNQKYKDDDADKYLADKKAYEEDWYKKYPEGLITLRGFVNLFTLVNNKDNWRVIREDLLMVDPAIQPIQGGGSRRHHEGVTAADRAAREREAREKVVVEYNYFKMVDGCVFTSSNQPAEFIFLGNRANKEFGIGIALVDPQRFNAKHPGHRDECRVVVFRYPPDVVRVLGDWPGQSLPNDMSQKVHHVVEAMMGSQYNLIDIPKFMKDSANVANSPEVGSPSLSKLFAMKIRQIIVDRHVNPFPQTEPPKKTGLRALLG